jgi:biopolymer transport protein ExbD
MITALVLLAIELPRLGTVGDLPPEKNRVVLEIDHTGAMKLDGKELSLAQLRGGQLKKFKAGTNFLLRVDRRVPYRAVHWVRIVFAEWGFDRMFYAVLPIKGDKVGAFALFVPRDYG